jgi:hypothetical protein
VRRLLAFAISLLVLASPAAADPISLQATGHVNALPTWAASIFPTSEVLFNLTIAPDHAVTFSGSIGGLTLAESRGRSWTHIEPSTTGNQRIFFEIDAMGPPGFNMTLPNRYLGAVYFFLEFAPGVLLGDNLPAVLPLDNLTSSSMLFHFWGQLGSGVPYGTVSSTVHTVQQIPEPASVAVVALGLLGACVHRHRRFRRREGARADRTPPQPGTMPLAHSQPRFTTT